jgi:hypothetical protein
MRTITAARCVLLLVLVPLAAACDKPAPAPAEADAAATATAAPSSAASAASATDTDAGAPAKPTGRTVDTPAGTMSEVGDEIRLSGKTIYPPPDCPAGGKDGCAKVKALTPKNQGVKLLRHFDGPGGQKSILLFQVSPADKSCEGGPLFFVRVAGNAGPQYSDVFDHCGPPDPMIGAMPDKILINVPAHPAKAGGAPVAAKNMEYDIATGTLVAAAPAAPKKKR